MSSSNHHVQPSAPVQVDLLTSDAYDPWDAVTPTATALNTTAYDSPQEQEAKIVRIPSSGVLLESNYSVPVVTNTASTTPYPTANPAALYGSSQLSSSFSGEHMEATATLYEATPQRYFKGKRVKPKNAHLPDVVLEFKEKRKRRTVLATCTGGAIGLVALGPLGGVLGATGAYAAAKSVGKRRERKLTQRELLQQQYRSSSLNPLAEVPRVANAQGGASIHRAEPA